MILTVTLNPSVDHAIFLDRLKLGDTNRVKRTETDAGGKGVNLARVATELGAETLAIGFLGGGNGAFVRKVLDRQGVKHDFIEIEGETRTNFSVEDESDEPPTTFNEPGPQVSKPDLEALLEKCEQHGGDAQWAALGGSLPPGSPPDFFAQLAELFRKTGCKVVLDADGEPLKLGIEAGVDFVKPNAAEAERLIGRPVRTLDDAAKCASELQGQGIGLVVVSMGEQGAALACVEGVFAASPPEVEVRSTIGSGDSLIGAMLWAMGAGKPLADAFRWGIAAGAATATTNGSEIARRPAVLELLDSVRVERVRGLFASP